MHDAAHNKWSGLLIVTAQHSFRIFQIRRIDMIIKLLFTYFWVDSCLSNCQFNHFAWRRRVPLEFDWKFWFLFFWGRFETIRLWFPLKKHVHRNYEIFNDNRQLNFIEFLFVSFIFEHKFGNLFFFFEVSSASRNARSLPMRNGFKDYIKDIATSAKCINLKCFDTKLLINQQTIEWSKERTEWLMWQVNCCL